MSKKNSERAKRREKNRLDVENDIWVDLPLDLLVKMRDAVPPEKWATTQTDLLQNYNLVLCQKGEIEANSWAARETEAFRLVGKKAKSDRAIDRGSKIVWGSSALARMLLEIFNN